MKIPESSDIMLYVAGAIGLLFLYLTLKPEGK